MKKGQREKFGVMVSEMPGAFHLMQKPGIYILAMWVKVAGKKLIICLQYLPVQILVGIKWKALIVILQEKIVKKMG